jgi:hypothetical protein
MEPYPFPNQTFCLSTTPSTFSPNRYIHTCFPALDCLDPHGIPLRISGASGTRNPSPSPTRTLWMTGTLADTNKNHYGNVYAIRITICLENQRVTACADFSYTAYPVLRACAFLLEVSGLHCGEGAPSSRMMVRVSVMQQVVCECWAICAWVLPQKAVWD